jgi:aspartate 1-decarboxylase
VLIPMLRAKIHRARVTEGNLNYTGSLTLDRDLMEAAGLSPLELVTITSIANGTFWQTYVLPGARGSGVVCMNGAAARHFLPGDLVIILSYVQVEAAATAGHTARVVLVDDENRVREILTEGSFPDVP